MTLTHTTRDKIDGKSYTVYRLFEEGKLLGECCLSGKYSFIRYNGTSIRIRDMAPWYLQENICFLDVIDGEETVVGEFHRLEFRVSYGFTLLDEEWVVRKLTSKEIDARSASHHWGGLLISSGESKQAYCTFNYPPPQGSIWRTYIERVGKIEANGSYLAPILLSCYAMEVMEKDKQSD